MRANAASLKALLLAHSGQLREAHSVAIEALELADAVGVATQFQSNPARLARAVIALQRGENAVAATHLAAVADRSFEHGDRGPHLVATVLLARVSALDDDLKSAFGLLERARTAWPGWTPPPALMAMIDAEETHLCLLSGDVPSARAVRAHLMDTTPDIPSVDLLQRIAEARLLLAEGHAGESSALLLSTAQRALDHQQLSTAVAATVGAAVARRAAGHVDDAITLLDQALELAHHENIRAPFLSEGEAVRPLLLRMEADRGFRRHDFRENLLTTIGVPPSKSVRPVHAGSGDGVNLSRQERAVLRQLSGTLSYRQIAASLDISVNTLKTHVRNIHRKLGADNRAQAIARARKIGLI
jgi:LuxR family transcriptional regulator, maltose regulon positive regulatory protein